MSPKPAAAAGDNAPKVPAPATHLFDEPDDELEEFESLDGQPPEVPPDPDTLQWEEGWDVAGWDDEDVDPELIAKLREELERYKQQAESAQQTGAAAAALQQQQ